MAQSGPKEDLQYAKQAQSGGGAGFGGGGRKEMAASPVSPELPRLRPRRTRVGKLGGYGGAKFRDIESDKEVAAGGLGAECRQRNALQAGPKALIAANAQEVDPDKDDAKIKKVKRFSDEYFELVKANTSEENALMARQQEGEELMIKLRGQVYRIE